MRKFYLNLAICVLSTLAANSQSSLDSGLVAYFPFNGNAGDSSIYGNHPTFNNAILTADRFGNANSAYRFNGNSSYMKIPNAASINMGSEVSVSLWVKVKGYYYGTCHSNRIINKSETDVLYNGNYAMVFDDQHYVTNSCLNPLPDTNHTAFFGATTGGKPSCYVVKDVWHHLVWTNNGHIGKFYLDNKLADSTYSSVVTNFTNPSDLYFGKMNAASYPYWFNGELDDVRIYNRAIDAGEVNTLFGGYTVVVPPTPTGDSSLVAYYPFNGNSGDSSVYGNHPTFNNATLTTDRFGNANSAYRFNGSSSYMRIPNAPSLNMGKKITIGAWVKVRGFYKGACHGNYVLCKANINATTPTSYLLAFDDAPFYNYNHCSQAVDTTHQNFYGVGGSHASLPYVQKDNWQYVVYVNDGINVKLYIDSRLTSSIVDSSNSFTNSGDLLLGKFDHPSYPYWFNGDLDDIRIYNRALSDSEITALHTGASYPTIRGKVFVDENSNGLMDNNDYPKANVRIDLSNGTYTFTDNNGNYEIFADNVGAFTVTAQAPALYTASPTSTNYFFNSFKAVVYNNIALQPTISKDSLSVSVIPFVMNPTPGGAYPYWIQYSNAGTTTLSPTVNVNYNNYMLSYDSCTDTNASPTATGLITGQANMPAGKQNNAIAFFTIKPSNNVGDTLVTTYGINESSKGISYSDSFYSILEASTSPNGQRATPSITQAQVAAGKEIVYTIGFKNTTNNKILDVVIVDSLSSYLQANTVKMIAASNKCKLTIKGNRLLFQLMDIAVPTATTNSLRSMGFVSFSVKPKNNLAANTVIVNKVYTSYNNFPDAVTTATTIVKPIVTPLNIIGYELKSLTSKTALNIWVTSSEVNVSHYNIQRSINSQHFETIGSVAANNRNENIYRFIDDKMPASSNYMLYYRIEAVDKDGKKTYSSIKTLNTKLQIANDVSIFPNPATTQLSIVRNFNKKESVTIVDIIGKVISIQNITSALTTINISDLNKGIYLLKFENGETVKFVKQ